ncbi:5'/3'-nucleotidase SurE [Peptoniphilus raoultii]|uniref:5'/3'-nucleotidase SurE n=1 Tax=Peptoniphilus raoultii TaxID=1776387 RepID=UPI0008D92A50|nr:5'/3'-nucleotidase SurE [Peptoniphilus raoultii]
MEILVTNDDGILAEGIKVIAKKLVEMGHKITIAAPNVENSGKSHAITFKTPLVVQNLKLEGLEEVEAIRVFGTPADCVRAAVHLCKKRFDFCFSGINSGYNAATNVLYSGTVSAAIEANLFNIRSLAVSSSYVNGQVNYESAAQIAMDLFEKIKDIKINQVYNLNVPYLPYDGIKGIKVAKVGRDVMSIYDITSEGNEYNLQLKGFPKQFNGDRDSDIYYLNQGYATVSPLIYDSTNKKSIESLKEIID